MIKQVLVFFVKSRMVLLAQKSSTAKVAASKWNGYGGDIEGNETPSQAAVREITEETDGGITVKEKDLIPRGCIDFFLSDNRPKEANFQVHLFVCYEFDGEAKQTKEMRKPTWVVIGQLEGLDMMPADREFVPQILGGRRMQGWVRFRPNLSGVESRYLEYF